MTEKTGWLVIKVVYDPDKGDVYDISSECDYNITHPAVLTTEVEGATEDFPL